MKTKYVLLTCAAAIAIYAGTSGCTRHEEQFRSQKREAGQTGEPSAPKAQTIAMTKQRSIPPSSEAPQPPSDSSTRDEPALSVSIEPHQPVTGDALAANVTGAQADDNELALTYAWIVNGEQVEQSASPLLGKPVKCGDFVELQVSSSDNLQEIKAASSIFIGNAAPSLRLVDQRLDENGLYLAQLEVSDPEQDSVAFSLLNAPPGMSIDPSAKAIRWAVGSDQTGAFQVVVSAKDAAGAEALLNYQIKLAREPEGRNEANGSPTMPGQ